MIAALVTPQLLTRPTAAPPAGPTASWAPNDWTFSGYRVGAFQVSDPYRWTLTDQTAEVLKDGAGPSSLPGLLTVYRPGFDPLAEDEARKGGHVSRTRTDPIHGRPAFSVLVNGSPMLLWEYAPGAEAILSPGPLGTPQNADTDHNYALTGNSIDYLLRVDLVHTGPGPDSILGSPTPGVTCLDVTSGPHKGQFRGQCLRWMPDGRHVLVASGRGGITRDDLRRLLSSATFADPDRTGTWYPTGEAFPTSALIGG